MLTLHHLNDSRSQRILWLLEELGVPYEMRPARRHDAAGAAGAEGGASARQVAGDQRRRCRSPSPARSSTTHPPLWQGPAHAGGRQRRLRALQRMAALCRRLGDAAADAGALRLRLGDAGAPLQPRIDSEIANHLGYINGALKGRDYLVGNLTGADIQMSFVGEMAKAFDKLGPYPDLSAWLSRMQRPAGVPALDREGRGLSVR